MNSSTSFSSNKELISKSFVELGQVVGVWGVKGWIKLHSYTRNRVDIGNYEYWWLQTNKAHDQPSQVKVQECREQGQGIIAKFDEVNDREQAEALRGKKIFVKQADMPALPDGEYYWHELIGLIVSNERQSIGIIGSMLETGANDVLVVKQNVQIADGSDKKLPDVLIPYTPQVVLQVDTQQGTMVVDWDPDFLLEN